MGSTQVAFEVVILRCTKKVLDELGREVGVLAELPPGDDDWYLNLLWIDRLKCLLITHAGTLFSVFQPGVRKADLRDLDRFVAGIVSFELASEGFPENVLGVVGPSGARLAKTASRSILGFMNEMAVHVHYAVDGAGGLDRCDIASLNRQLRRTLHNRGEYVYPIDLVMERRLLG